MNLTMLMAIIVNPINPLNKKGKVNFTLPFLSDI